MVDAVGSKRSVRELKRLLGRKTLEVAVLKEALVVAREKSPPGSCRQLPPPPRIWRQTRTNPLHHCVMPLVSIS
jgi:hypothetical protein